ncbi:hypothetical protein HC766_06470 [Candidatus Gracilibacteria bacterium]|nr:hypothetical protein [Candidatus Gracilibacteria bacterium]
MTTLSRSVVLGTSSIGRSAFLQQGQILIVLTHKSLNPIFLLSPIQAFGRSRGQFMPLLC